MCIRDRSCSSRCRFGQAGYRTGSSARASPGEGPSMSRPPHAPDPLAVSPAMPAPEAVSAGASEPTWWQHVLGPLRGPWTWRKDVYKRQHLGSSSSSSVLWNLGIRAVAAGQPRMRVWRSSGCGCGSRRASVGSHSQSTPTSHLGSVLSTPAGCFSVRSGPLSTVCLLYTSRCV